MKGSPDTEKYALTLKRLQDVWCVKACNHFPGYLKSESSISQDPLQSCPWPALHHHLSPLCLETPTSWDALKFLKHTKHPSVCLSTSPSFRPLSWLCLACTTLSYGIPPSPTCLLPSPTDSLSFSSQSQLPHKMPSWWQAHTQHTHRSHFPNEEPCSFPSYTYSYL